MHDESIMTPVTPLRTAERSKTPGHLVVLRSSVIEPEHFQIIMAFDYSCFLDAETLTRTLATKNPENTTIILSRLPVETFPLHIKIAQMAKLKILYYFYYC